jgi:hypothetical protein
MIMGRFALLTAIFGFLAVHCPCSAVETVVSVDVVSAYVFRGVTYNDGPCIQAGVQTLGSMITFALWANYDLSEYGEIEAGDFSEVDLTLV